MVAVPMLDADTATHVSKTFFFLIIQIWPGHGMDATGTWLATIFKIIIIFLKKDLIYNKSLKCAV